MTHKELQQLSNSELIDLILCHQPSSSLPSIVGAAVARTASSVGGSLASVAYALDSTTRTYIANSIPLAIVCPAATKLENVRLICPQSGVF